MGFLGAFCYNRMEWIILWYERNRSLLKSCLRLLKGLKKYLWNVRSMLAVFVVNTLEINWPSRAGWAAAVIWEAWFLLTFGTEREWCSWSSILRKYQLRWWPRRRASAVSLSLRWQVWLLRVSRPMINCQLVQWSSRFKNWPSSTQPRLPHLKSRMA